MLKAISLAGCGHVSCCCYSMELPTVSSKTDTNLMFEVQLSQNGRSITQRGWYFAPPDVLPV